MNFEQEFYANFGDKYSELHLKEVVVKKRENLCTITFLSLSTAKDLTDENKKEITDWLKNKLNLEKLTLKVKFMKVYLEERLILKSLLSFFETKYKLIISYITEKSFKINITNLDVVVDIELSERMFNFFEEHKISAELAKFMKDNFLVDFTINLVENKNLMDEVDIENVEMKTSYQVAKRHTVEIVKEIVGSGITPKPEYLSFVTTPKNSVIVAGFIKKIERKDYVVKSGKHVGDQRTLFNFQIADGKGKIDCVYFCAKRNVQVMEALEETMYILVHGDAKTNQLGKLCLYVDKIALATELDDGFLPEKQVAKPEGPVVEIEKLAAMEQNSMFKLKDRYNNKIMGKQIVVFDIETTGLDPATDQIIELGAVKIENGNIVEKFSTFVKPTVKIPFEVSQLTGITQDMVEDAPPIEYVIKDFYDFTRGCTLSGHNVINFDIKFIKREGENYGYDFDNPLIDTLNEARVARLKTSRFNLGTITKLLGISLEGAHRAWNDAFATAQVLLKLNEVN